jgi:hypothetical protein
MDRLNMQYKVSKYITNPPFALQISKDDKWEEAWIIDISKSQPTENELEEYLKKNETENIAIEILFKDEADQVYILGLFFNNHLLTKTTKEFLLTVLTEAYEFQDYLTLLSNLDQKLIGHKYLLESEPDIIRIGIVNHWFSVGPVMVWQQGLEKEISEGLLNERLNIKPEVVKTDLNYQGMSFIFDLEEKEICHIMKAPCSKYEDGFWKLDNKLILHYLKDWQGFKIIRENWADEFEKMANLGEDKLLIDDDLDLVKDFQKLRMNKN